MVARRFSFSLAIVLGLVPVIAAEQKLIAADVDWQLRYDLFQMLLEERGLETRSDPKHAFRFPEKSVVVIAGDTARSLRAADWDELSQFVERGGGLVLASHRAWESSRFGNCYSGPVTSDNVLLQHQGYRDCLRIPPEAATEEILSGVATLVTNRSGWFVPNRQYSWRIYARLPAECQPLAARNQVLLAVGSSPSGQGGRVVVYADGSLLTNGMMWHGDNAIAAIRMTEMICRVGKSQLVFISNGEVRRSYQERLGEPVDLPDPRDLPQPAASDLLALGNAIVNEIVQSNVLNETLRRQPRRLRPARYFRALLIAASIIFLLGSLWYLIRSRRQKISFPPTRRMRAAYELKDECAHLPRDYRQPAASLAREFCLELTGSQHSGDWRRYQAETAPALLSAQKQQELARIIDIACRGSQVAFNQRSFQQFGKSIRTLRASILDRIAQPAADPNPWISSLFSFSTPRKFTRAHHD